jgi:predicted dehydrogenase
MLENPELELVYVSTLMNDHYKCIKLALEHGKNVICEKSFTETAAQAKELLTLSEKKGLLLTEAMWTRYLPMRSTIDKVLDSGVIGKVHSLHASLGYPVMHIDRIAKKSMGGGALLDLGCYIINFAFMHFGSTGIKKIDAAAIRGGEDVDTALSITITYRDGRLAILHADARARTDRRGMFYGEKGYIETLNINNCEGIRVFDTDDRRVCSIETPAQITGFEYQIEACCRAIIAGCTECPEYPHTEITRVMEAIDEVRKIAGL